MKNKSDSIRMLKYFKNYKVSILLLTIFTIVFCVIGVVNPIVGANLLTSLTNFDPPKAFKFALIMIGVSITNCIVSYLMNYIYTNDIKQKLILNIRKDMIKNIFTMQTVNFDKHNSGEFTNRIKNDPEQISTILSVVQYSFFNLLTDVFILGYILYLNYILGIVYIISCIIVFFYQKNTLEKIKKMSEENRKINDKNLGLLTEIIRGIRDIKILNINRKIHNMMIKGLDEGTALEGKKNIKTNMLYDTVTLFEEIQSFIVIIIGIYLVFHDMLSGTNLVIIYMYRNKVQDLSICYRSIKSQLNEFSIASKRIFEFMDKDKYPKETFGNKELNDVVGKIEIKDLVFAYDKKKVLNGINLTIKPRETIGIVGESGSGKTTLLSLLSKSYPIDNGKILIDGVDLNDLTKNSIRDNIAVISQNPYIFNLTIKENLELIGDNISKDDIINACKVAQIHDYIMTLPDKYNTLLGEGGINLSGGQRQRLAIARALLKKSKIILFDEATSALDNITQNELQKSINNISKDYTIIIVAHRLSTIKDCNKIYVMDKGRIVGKGTHDKLLESNKYYKKLYKEEII